MISVNKIYKRFPDGHHALKNIDFTVNDGEIIFLSGPSGAGKSTLLKLIASIERPTSGNIMIKGQHLNQLKPNTVPFLRRNIGLIFQDHKILFNRNVFENVQLPLQIAGFDYKKVASRVRAALDKVGLLNKEKALPITLSGGERQRLCIARAVVHRPTILIADEPTGNLDIDYAKEIMRLFQSFNQVGVTILIATHDVTLLDDTQHRILPLHQGELIS